MCFIICGNKKNHKKVWQNCHAWLNPRYGQRIFSTRITRSPKKCSKLWLHEDIRYVLQEAANLRVAKYTFHLLIVKMD